MNQNNLFRITRDDELLDALAARDDDALGAFTARATDDGAGDARDDAIIDMLNGMAHDADADVEAWHASSRRRAVTPSAVDYLIGALREDDDALTEEAGGLLRSTQVGAGAAPAADGHDAAAAIEDEGQRASAGRYLANGRTHRPAAAWGRRGLPIAASVGAAVALSGVAAAVTGNGLSALKPLTLGWSSAESISTSSDVPRAVATGTGDPTALPSAVAAPRERARSADAGGATGGSAPSATPRPTRTQGAAAEAAPTTARPGTPAVRAEESVVRPQPQSTSAQAPSRVVVPARPASKSPAASTAASSRPNPTSTPSTPSSTPSTPASSTPRPTTPSSRPSGSTPPRPPSSSAPSVSVPSVAVPSVSVPSVSVPSVSVPTIPTPSYQRPTRSSGSSPVHRTPVVPDVALPPVSSVVTPPRLPSAPNQDEHGGSR